MRSFILALSGVTLVLCPRDALADGHGMGAQVWVEAAGSYMPSSTGLDVSTVSNSARENIAGTTPAFGFATGYFGARAGIDFIAADRWIIPLFDIGLYGVIGTYADTLTSADGSLFRLHPAGTIMFDAELFGIGLRFKKRRWMVEGSLKPGIAVLAVPAAVADGKGFTDVDSLNSITPTLRAQLSLCRRLDPTERVCLSVTPNIYQWGWGNGGSVSLRWEIGS